VNLKLYQTNHKSFSFLSFSFQGPSMQITVDFKGGDRP
jgi:hypothetical protein